MSYDSSGRIKCDHCGKYISYFDIEKGDAIHNVSSVWCPWQEDVRETTQSECKKCKNSNGDTQ
jgi:hypothetical protein